MAKDVKVSGAFEGDAPILEAACCYFEAIASLQVLDGHMADAFGEDWKTNPDCAEAASSALKLDREIDRCDEVVTATPALSLAGVAVKLRFILLNSEGSTLTAEAFQSVLDDASRLADGADLTLLKAYETTTFDSLPV